MCAQFMPNLHPQGVLSQTLASSPCVKTILSARVRSPQLNDVIFVSHSSIHLREFSQTGELSPILASLELGAQIHAVKVISAEEHILSTEDAILENGRDEVRYKIHGELCDDSQPPQVIVLSLSCGELVFAYAKTSHDGHTNFAYMRRQILPNRSHARLYGKQLAIDNGSRVLAAAASKDRLALFTIKQVDELTHQIDSWDPRSPETTSPFVQQKFVMIDGVILRMDFLRSSNLDPHRVVLLLIVANAGTTRLLLYRWDSRKPRDALKPLKCSGQPLPPEDSFPHLLIPSCRYTSFAIVTGPKIVFYDDVHSNSMKRSSVSLKTDKAKHWVQYAKAVRHAEHKKKNEDIFLVREDGYLENIVVKHIDSRSSINLSPGQLGIRVDTAFCALSAPPMLGGDILIACSDTTAGGVFHLAAKERPRLLQSLPNWGPINNLVRVNGPKFANGQYGPASVFATMGMHNDGSYFSEICRGLEAQLVLDMVREEANTIDRLWLMEYRPNMQLLVLAAHHEHSSLMSYSLTSGEFSMESAATYPAMSFDHPTLAACTLGTRALVQITSRAVKVISAAAQEQDNFPSLNGSFLHAATMCIASQAIFVVADNVQDNVFLRAGMVADTCELPCRLEEFPNNAALKYVPTSLDLVKVGERVICISTSQNGTVYFYQVDPELGLDLVAREKVEHPQIDGENLSFSSVATLKFEKSSSTLVICGTKTGQLILWEIDAVDRPIPGISPLMIKLSREPLNLGDTPVRVKVESSALTENEMSAFITCGPKTIVLQSHRTAQSIDYTLESLLVTNAADPFFEQPAIHAIDRIGHITAEDGVEDLSGLVVCATDDRILLLSIGHSSTILRLIRSVPYSKHLVYSPSLGKCVVGVQGDMGIDGQMTRPSLLLLDSTRPKDSEASPHKIRTYFGDKGESIRAMCSWQPTDGKSHYDLLIIGTDYQGQGRLAYILDRRVGQAKPGGAVKVFATFADKTIHAICAYGKAGLAVCAGRELRIVYFNMATRNFELKQSFELPSKAIEMQAKGSVIYIATSAHSFMLVREDEGKLRRLGGDSWAGRASNIIPYGSCSTLVNLVSEQGSRLVNFPERPVKGSVSTFEATVPQSIDRLVPMRTSQSKQKREQFLGTTIDGTIYLFSILTEREMKLLGFLQGLCEPIRHRGTKDMSYLAHNIAAQFGNRLESAGIMTPNSGATHARGDLLKGLLDKGPYNLRFLLKQRGHAQDPDSMIKQEDEIDVLTDLAEPLLGTTGDVVDRVTIWLRSLLNMHGV